MKFILAFFLISFPLMKYSYAGKVELKIDNKISFYETSPNPITVMKGLVCYGEEELFGKTRIVTTSCVYNGSYFSTNSACDHRVGTGFSFLSVVLPSKKKVVFKVHCNGQTI